MEIKLDVWSAVVLGGLLPLLGWLLWWWNDIWYALPAKLSCAKTGTKLPPGHMGLPYIGEIYKFLWYFKVVGRPDDFVNSKRLKYGDNVGLYRTYMFGTPAVIAWSPLACKYIFQLESSFIREWPTIELMGFKSLVGIQGAEHRRLKTFVLRSINQPVPLRQIARVMSPRVAAALQSWADKGRFMAWEEASKVIFEIMANFLVGFEPGSILDYLAKQFLVMDHGYRASPIKIPGTAFYKAVQSRKRVMEVFREELEKRKDKLERGEAVPNDVMDGLMQLKDEEGKRLSDMEVLDNIVNLIIGGHKSTALAIMWAIYYLAKYPDVFQKLREENIGLSKKKNGELVTSDDIAKLTYTNKVVEEIIRLSNIAFLIFRTATKDVEYKGYKIPKGWKVVLLLRYLHTDPESYDDPMCFNPDRRNETPKPGSFYAFGGGSRICAGNMLARLTITIFLHYFATGYEWKLVNPEAKWNYVPHLKPVDGVETIFKKI